MELYVVADKRPLSREQVGHKLAQARRIDLVNQSSTECREPVLKFPFRSTAISGITLSVHAEGESALTTTESTNNFDLYRTVPYDYLPKLDEEAYYHFRAEFEVEPLTEFNPLEFYSSEYYNLEGIVIPPSLIDDLIGAPPVHAKRLVGNPPVELEMHIVENRRRTFIELEWDRRVTDVAPRLDLLVASGFFYTGENDSVLCFWCGLGLDHWERGDVPDMEHTRFSPRCSWLLRHIGQPAVRRLLLNDMRLNPQFSPESVEHAEKERVGILRNWDETRGGIKCAYYSNMDFRFEARELRSRLDLPSITEMQEKLKLPDKLIEYAFQTYLNETGDADDIPSLQHLLETIWEYQAQMNESSISDPGNFVARSRLMKTQALVETCTLEGKQVSPKCPLSLDLVCKHKLSMDDFAASRNVNLIVAPVMFSSPDTSPITPTSQPNAAPLLTRSAPYVFADAPQRREQSNFSISIGRNGHILNFAWPPIKWLTTVNEVSLCSVPDGIVSSDPLPELEPCAVCLEVERTHVASPCGHFALCERCILTLHQAPCPVCRANVNEYIRVQRLHSSESDTVRRNPPVRENETVPAATEPENNERKVSPCVFCSHPDSTHILIPCGHTFCDVCAQQHPRSGTTGVEEHCPCRNCSLPIRSSIRFYRS